jgi:putative NADH-flavin reductase
MCLTITGVWPQPLDLRGDGEPVKVIVFGATGMVGAGVLIECFEDPRVRSVLVIGRHSVGISNAKLRELIRTDFFDYRDARGDLSGYDACFFCIGVSAADGGSVLVWQ